MREPKPTKTRVAVYLRIGGTGDCETACQKQTAHFIDVVSKNPDWRLTEIYADLGADSRKQPALNRLLADCRAGRVDLIVTKSTSRISRSINVLMGIVRRLAYLKPPVGIYFEDTKLNTLERDNLLFLTLFEAMSIHESEAKNGAMPHILLTQHLKAQEKQRKKSKPKKEEESDDE
jgi:DNA invertase Pin-like site-specific DNA recombinase